MSQIIISAFITLLFLGMLLFSADVTVTSTTHIDNRDALQQSADAALMQSVNKGTLRVEQEIEIDPVEAEQVFYEAYEQNTSFKDEVSDVAPAVVSIQAKPAMIAVQAKRTIPSYFEMFNQEGDGVMDSWAKTIVIYEAKEDVKQEGGNTN